ncbi:hypothetical protein BDV40DRAFT_297140 [Aspergillus tamarii]|uniref:Xylanolytic transcriptional activator xlnR n=1 Tax=Aspergillus tamarii TaxID=41984 RepID=A0A5N6V419_ASPTM|nr:hypothetical protein BDV40DRAFT_297140 [Aspergillus tamarii]
MSSRACDRCWALKTQCDSQCPCARCRRLQLPCLTERPVRAKGRPRKSVSSRQGRATVREPSVEPESQSSGQTILSSVSPANVSPAAATISHDISSILLDPSLTNSLLQWILSSSRKLGIFGLLPDSLHADTETGNDFSVRQILNRELQNALLAIALDLYRYRLPETVAGSLDVSRGHLQRSALAETPCLTWKSHQLQLGNALLLLLFSYTWCLSAEFSDIAIRWHSLSHIILEDISKTPSQDNDWNELTRRTEMSLYIQDAILALLHNQRKPSCQFQVFTKSQVADNIWHASSSFNSVPAEPWTLEANSYFVLMHPLVNCMRAVIEAPLFGSRAWAAVRNDLCDYFFRFPPALLRFDDLTYVYEAEAMIWMHGLFIILYGTRDLVDLIMNPVYHKADRFSYLLEHSFLLGDVLPTVLSLDPYLESLSPATIVFLLQSSTIHAIALRQFFSDNGNHALFENGVPVKLVRSSDHHHNLLSAVELHCKRYDIPIIGEIRTLLSTCLSRAAFRNTDARIISTQQLMHYRWCGTGTGITPLQRDEAVRAWQYPISPGDELWQEPSEIRDELQRLIGDLCAPNTRICRNGYFDLSILIR